MTDEHMDELLYKTRMDAHPDDVLKQIAFFLQFLKSITK